jgi:hypothetical protein
MPVDDPIRFDLFLWSADLFCWSFPLISWPVVALFLWSADLLLLICSSDQLTCFCWSVPLISRLASVDLFLRSADLLLLIGSSDQLTCFCWSVPPISWLASVDRFLWSADLLLLICSSDQLHFLLVCSSVPLPCFFKDLLISCHSLGPDQLPWSIIVLDPPCFSTVPSFLQTYYSVCNVFFMDTVSKVVSFFLKGRSVIGQQIWKAGWISCLNDVSRWAVSPVMGKYRRQLCYAELGSDTQMDFKELLKQDI